MSEQKSGERKRELTAQWVASKAVIAGSQDMEMGMLAEVWRVLYMRFVAT